MADALTLEDLSRRTGEPEERLQLWRSQGLIGKEGADEFDLVDVGRARLIHDMLHYGHSLEAIAEAAKRPDSIFQYFLEGMSQHFSRPLYTVPAAAEMAGIDLGVARRFMEATGIGEHGDYVDGEDVEFFRACKISLDAGYPEDALLQVLRVYSETMARAAEVSQRTSHFYLHQPLEQQGLPPERMMEQLRDTFSKIEPLVEPALMYFFRKGAAKGGWDDMLMHLEEEAGLAEKPETPGQVRQAVMFVDLANFTPLAEAMGDLKAAEVLDRFREVVRVAIRRCHGRIVKQIGDAFMIVFPECYSAVSCALEIEERCGAEPQFPAARAGLHWGPVLYREGDYLGSNVNIASRLGSDAQRHQILVSAEVRNRAKGLEGAEFIWLGKRRLKGLVSEVEIFEARATGPGLPERMIDPVCGMELGSGEVAAKLTLDGRDQAFCSEECLRKFVRNPEKYVG